MLKNVYDILFQIYSSEGYSSDSFNIKATTPCLFTLDVKDETVELSFDKNAPIIRFNKKMGLITPLIKIKLLGIVFNKEFGMIKLENFFDIKFKYE